MLCSLANNVDKPVLDKINALEKDLGKTFLAYKCHSVNTTMLTDAELKKVQEIEKELGVSLIAVEN
ncbi:hypothetical protein JWJ90_20685 [Desulfobulbus rhabdoformis]|uniref:hypothetical protein n=1 Tax=Desulfobulbus rhabdoformis TaxID=34032 RepID=UPI0019625EBE|nr:hypothetical protein [Desulfobulbus rhabdoformis]MBM9616685.1 hypothetical protein [Desulfobulbus rhabdoformis]